MMQMAQRMRGDWHVVSAEGRADASAADELESALCGAVGLNPQVAADFSGLTYISSAGLRAVLQAARAAQLKDSKFVVYGLQAGVKRVFEISGMQQLVQVEDELPC
jgi:anti-anti-sigma factor